MSNKGCSFFSALYLVKKVYITGANLCINTKKGSSQLFKRKDKLRFLLPNLKRMMTDVTTDDLDLSGENKIPAFRLNVGVWKWLQTFTFYWKEFVTGWFNKKWGKGKVKDFKE